ncbi:hypothetical protein ACV346_29830, partial [Pseudomonas aeruginosa]
KLLNKDPPTVTKYSNPLGDLGDYLSQLSPQAKLNQAQTLVGQPISCGVRSYLRAAADMTLARDEDAKGYQAAVSIKSANT